MNDERRSNAAFVIVFLEELERRVAGVGPAEAVAGKGTVRAQLAALFALESVQAGFIAAPVIGQKEDHRVLGLIQIRYSFEDVADRLVHAVDHRGINRHALVHLLLFGLVECFPGRRTFVSGTNRPALIDQPHLQLTRMALSADGIPAFEIFAAILFDVLFQGVQRPVRRGERHVQEERLIIFISTMFTNELRAVLANGGSVVKVLRKLRDRRVI